MPHQLRTTMKQAIAQTVSELRRFADPQLDAQWLLLKVMEKDEASWLLSHTDECLTKQQELTLAEYVARRIQGEPLAYILGEWEFYGRSFAVNKDVLVPRPSTETLIETALTYIKDKVLPAKNTPISEVVIADIGTGSGCIAITLGLEMTKWQMDRQMVSDWKCIASDISVEALAVAKQNVEKYRLENKVDFRLGSLLQPLQETSVDLIVSNPPYVPAAELANVANDDYERSGLRYEPQVALDGGKDGLVVVNELIKTSMPLIYESLDGEIKSANLI